MTGNGAMASLIGKPDIGLATMSEMVMQAHQIAGCINIPLICDADTGYHDIASLMKEVANGSEIKRIAIGDMAIIPHGVYAAVAAAIPDADVVGFDREMDDLCMNKTAWEASMVRQACLISEKGFDATLGKINPEMTEYELEGILAGELHKNGGEGPSFPS